MKNKFNRILLAVIFSITGLYCNPAASNGEITPSVTKKWSSAPLRGINIDTGSLNNNDFDVIKSWGVNLIRVSIGENKSTIETARLTETLNDSLSQYSESLSKVDEIVRLAGINRIFVILTASDIIGRSNDVTYSKFDNSSFYYNVIPLWIHLSKKFRNNPWVLAYDILNEPNGGDAFIWTDEISKIVISEIRKNDKETYIIYEPAPWALPDQGFANLQPIQADKIVYSFHFYYPHTYTHQGIKRYTSNEYLNKEYPGELKLFPNSPLIMWNKNELEKSMKNVIDFQAKFNVNILVGEFGAVRWARGVDLWLLDSISIFEKYGWSWLFHSYGDRWNGWNPTFDPLEEQSSKVNGAKKTKSLDVLISSFSKNKNK